MVYRGEMLGAQHSSIFIPQTLMVWVIVWMTRCLILPQGYLIKDGCYLIFFPDADDWDDQFPFLPDTELSVKGAKPLSGCRGLNSQTGSPYPHTALVHTKAHELACVFRHHPLPTPTYPALPLNLALRCLVGCGTKLSCVSGGNASPLSTERLFDDGLLRTSLWFQNLQRAGPRMDLACSQKGHKSQGPGTYRPPTPRHTKLI